MSTSSVPEGSHLFVRVLHLPHSSLMNWRQFPHLFAVTAYGHLWLAKLRWLKEGREGYTAGQGGQDNVCNWEAATEQDLVSPTP